MKLSFLWLILIFLFTGCEAFKLASTPTITTVKSDTIYTMISNLNTRVGIVERSKAERTALATVADTVEATKVKVSNLNSTVNTWADIIRKPVVIGGTTGAIKNPVTQDALNTAIDNLKALIAAKADQTIITDSSAITIVTRLKPLTLTEFTTMKPDPVLIYYGGKLYRGNGKEWVELIEKK